MDEADTARAHKLMARMHVLIRLADWSDIMRRRSRRWVGIAVTSNQRDQHLGGASPGRLLVRA